jgi:hypothetical protein
MVEGFGYRVCDLCRGAAVALSYIFQGLGLRVWGLGFGGYHCREAKQADCAVERSQSRPSWENIASSHPSSVPAAGRLEGISAVPVSHAAGIQRTGSPTLISEP